jgi:hypothetical protein
VFNRVANRPSEKALNRAIGSIFIIVGIVRIVIGSGGGENAGCAALTR